MTEVAIEGFSHVAIDVDDLEAAVHFYCDQLGFSQIERPDLGFPGAWLGVGELQLHLSEVAAMPERKAGFPHFALYVPTEVFETTMEALRSSGVRFLGAPSSRVDFGTTVLAAFVSDPAGNTIELTDVGPRRGRGPSLEPGAGR